jgi:hypothetical protein
VILVGIGGIMTEPYPDEMFEEAARREAENKALEALEKLYDENDDALQQLASIEWKEREELAKKSFEELTKEEKIKLALEEVDWIVIGGQDGQEFYGSIQFIRKVLRSL